MSFKDLLRDLTPSGVLEQRRAAMLCQKHGLVPAPGVSIREAALAGKLCGATLFQPQWLREINSVIDVGANVGQWSGFWTSIQQPQKILSVEPNPDCFKILEAKTKKRPGWTCVNCAAGERDETVTFNVPADTTSASLLEVKSTLGWTSEAEIKNPKQITVPLKRVDQLAADWPEISLLKVDAEGYEGQVLAGAEGLLKRTKFILVELTWFERFKDGATIWGVHDQLQKQGFVFWGIGETTVYGGRAVFCDGLFVRSDLVPKS